MGNREAILLQRQPRDSSTTNGISSTTTASQQQQEQQGQSAEVPSTASDDLRPANRWSFYKPKQREFLESLSDDEFRELRTMVFKCLLKNLFLFCGPFVALAGGAEICGRLKLVQLPPRYARISLFISIFVSAGAAAITAPMTKCGGRVKSQFKELNEKHAGQLGSFC
ncbi:hypothetical protein niasHT_037846 [Heterodera trifolii]|uniref:Transmembrane protein n=1 Tax=Heterodera trifolii TaxID=157864 RepID=A0ABD2J151_9BILA